MFSGLESGTDIGFSGSEITNLTKVQGSGYGRLRYGYCRCANQSKMALLAAYKVTSGSRRRRGSGTRFGIGLRYAGLR